MKLQVLGSSSSGNSYLLIADNGEVLAIEAGMKFTNVKKALNFNVSSLVGCIVSHEHGDHAKYISDYLNACIPVYTSAGTLQALNLANNSFAHTLRPQQTVTLGSFKVYPFTVQHDAQEPFGYIIRNAECGVALFATDTYYLKYKFSGLTNILLECNYRIDLLDKNIADGVVSPLVRNRIVKSHMSYNTCLETLLANDLSKVNNIVLIHLSDNNSLASEFVEGIANATDKKVVAATKDMIIDFNKTPY